MRLNATVFNVEPCQDRSGYSPVDYVLNRVPDGDHHGHHGHGNGKNEGRRVWARHVVMACWNRVTAHVVEGLPQQQVEGLCYARKVPLIYGRAALNNWQAFADAKVASISPRGTSLFWDNLSVARRRRLRPHRHAGQVLRADAQPAADRARAADVHRRPEPPRRGPAAVRVLDRPADAARAELARTSRTR